jgi:dTDP-4-dehydrorhamnose 3,5-epimerase
MAFEQTAIPDVLVFKPIVFGDKRGFFLETFRADLFSRSGIPGPFVQDNHSGSQKGILRGLHYQIRQGQGKLVRRSSPTFGRWVGVLLSAENKLQVWIPIGFAHGFYVLSDWADVIYKSTDYYAPEWERTLRWNDPALEIGWPLLDGLAPLVSEKDSLGKLLSEAELFE